MEGMRLGVAGTAWQNKAPSSRKQEGVLFTLNLLIEALVYPTEKKIFG